jgi:hypothetical protein
MKVTGRVVTAARQLDRFTTTELAAWLNVSRSSAMVAVDVMLASGQIVDTGERKLHDGPGRPAPVYRYVEVKSQPHSRPKAKPPELVAAEEARGRRQRSSVSTRRKRKGRPDAELRRLQNLWRDQLGGEVELARRGGHWLFFDREGNLVTTHGSTSSDHRALKNLRAALRQAGLRC